MSESSFTLISGGLRVFAEHVGARHLFRLSDGRNGFLYSLICIKLCINYFPMLLQHCPAIQVKYVHDKVGIVYYTSTNHVEFYLENSKSNKYRVNFVSPKTNCQQLFYMDVQSNEYIVKFMHVHQKNCFPFCYKFMKVEKTKQWGLQCVFLLFDFFR